MTCRHCNLQEEETQEHLVDCKDMRIKVKVKEHDHMVFWRKLSWKLNEIIYKENHEENMGENLPMTVK